MSKPKIPKDLEVKIGTKKEAFWTQVKTASEEAITNSENTIMLHTEIVKLAEEQIKKEKI